MLLADEGVHVAAAHNDDSSASFRLRDRQLTYDIKRLVRRFCPAFSGAICGPVEHNKKARRIKSDGPL